MKMSKLKIALDGILIPFLIYFLLTMLVSGLYIFVTGNEKPNLILVQGYANIFIFGFLCPLYIHFTKKYNIRSKSFNFSTGLYMIPIAFSVCIIGNILVDFIPRANENIVTMEVYKLAEEYNVFLSLFIVSVLIPIIEELIFRGFFYDAIKLMANDVIAIIFSSIAFAVAHVDLRQALYALFAGVILAYIKYKYKSLIYPIILHLLMNLTSLVIVPTVLAVTDIKYKLFTLFISVAILVVSIYRINITKNIS